MSKELLFSLLEEIKNAGYTVVAMTCDLGGSNRGLLTSLNVSEDQPWYFHLFL